MKKKISIIIGTFLIALMLGINAGSAQNVQSEGEKIRDLQDQENQQAAQSGEAFTACFKGWRQFVSSLIGYRGFLDYWAEVIEPNICYRTDLEALTQQADKARAMVRSTFLRCELKNLDRYSSAYYKLEAELYFVRHMLIPRSSKAGPVIDRISDPAQMQAFVKELNDYFVIQKGFLTESVLQDYIQEFAAKYRNRLDTYKNCRDDYYEELSAKVDEIKQNFKDFGAVFEKTPEEKKQEEEEAKRLERLKLEGYDPTENPRKGPFFALGEDLNLNFGLAKLQVEPEKSFGDLVDTLKNPGGKLQHPQQPQGISFSQAEESAAHEKQRVVEESNVAEMKARFEFLYAQMGDEAVRDMTVHMDDLINLVKNTAPAMDDVLKCVNDAGTRECKNKK